MFWFRPLFSCFILVCFDIHFAQHPSRTPRHDVKNEQPNKRPKKDHFPSRRDCEDNCGVAISKSASQLGCVSQDSDALVSQGRKSRENPMQKVLEPIQQDTIHGVYATSCEYPGKGRTIAWKIQVKNPHQQCGPVPSRD